LYSDKISSAFLVALPLGFSYFTPEKEERKEKVDLKITLLNIIKYYFVILLFH